ncbi:DNA repair protein RecN [Curvivirga aplysinae]|uniref:DNA repair protein RecN n=1 Tax=Curvivirga aplysinae TaxID=2529852 RepID=UPI0012BB600B|nr:DNA repair protein RecN [Curvivirga aplysinae]MTI10772.1 DNA repair protein RecN [Curvivirga aplysinae]
MLTDLSIRDVVLIDKLDLSFHKSLSVLTGETGAGKSILLDSLGLALGARAEARLVRHGCEQAVVTASFDLPDLHPAYNIMAEHGIDCDGQLILRRILSADGRSRAYVNDQPVSVGLLRQLGDTLVEVQGQFDQHGLMDSTTHIDVLDSFAATLQKRLDCASAYSEWKKASKALKQAREDAEKAREDEAYLRHTLDEMERFAPVDGEEEELDKERSFLQNAEKLTDAIRSALASLDHKGGADDKLRDAQKSLDRIADKAEGKLDEAIATLDRANAEMMEAINILNQVGHDVTSNDMRLNDVEERLFELRDLARKHNVQPHELPSVLDRLRQSLALIDDTADNMQALEEKVAASKARYLKIANLLTETRVKKAAELNDAVNSELPPLKLEKARFETTIIELEEKEWTAFGKDKVAFQIATNPGAPAGPLNKVASGGELSRFLLALKVSLAETGATPSLVFDEVDAGVGGATAAAIGERLHKLAQRVQILVVTHSPQVAARGLAHLQVAKSMRGEAMVTDVSQLTEDQRLEEVARMLSGAEITNEARAAAAKLLESNK